MTVYFENLTVVFHFLYVLKTYIKFHFNQILFTIWSINLFFIYNFSYKNSKFNYLIDHDIAIDIYIFFLILQIWRIYEENVIQ